jgi:hypothetical protein
MKIQQKAWKVTSDGISETVYAPTAGKAKTLFMMDHKVGFTQIKLIRSPKEDIIENEHGQPELRFLFEKRQVKEYKVINSSEDITL